MTSIFNWKFWQKAAVGPLSTQVQRQMADDRGVSDQAAATLRMVQQRGNYAGRMVTYFRVFSPAAVERSGIEVREYSDLDAHMQLQLYTGFFEDDGQVVLNQQQASPSFAS